MGVSGFLGHRNENMRLKEYEIKVLPMNSNNSQIDKALYLPKICWSIKGQNLSCTVKNHDFIRNLPLADAIFDSGANIYILIDVDLYWQLVKGEVKRTKNCNLVARNSIFAG